MSLLLLAVIAASPGEGLETRTPKQAAARIAKNVQTGTLLFSKGDCLAVKVYSGSKVTHVGAVVLRKGKPYVYESANGAGVRRLSLQRYLELQQPCDVRVIHPTRPFSAARERAFVKALDKELDKRQPSSPNETNKIYQEHPLSQNETTQGYMISPHKWYHMLS